jgi:FkbM family methyltransferase
MANLARGTRLTVHRLARRLLHLIVRALPRGVALPVLTGPLRGARWIVHSSNPGCWAGRFEKENQAFAWSALRRGDVFVDAGANVGFFTLLGARAVGREGRVFAFEPLPANREALEKHVVLNGLTNVVVSAAALSDRTGRGRFGHRGAPSCARLMADGEYDVATTRLDEALGPEQSSRVRLIKIDVEGAEASVLVGARELLGDPPRPALMVATHGWRAHEECLTVLRAYDCHPLDVAMDEPSGNGSIRFLGSNSGAVSR